MEPSRTITSHNLDFMISPNPFFKIWIEFKVGTCTGLYRTTGDAYEILTIVNRESGNGHLEDVLEWFEHSCRRDGKHLRFMEMMNEDFARHLITKRGFQEHEFGNVQKTFK